MSSVGLRTAYNTAEWLVRTVTRTAVVGGKRHLRLGFVFYTEKSSTPRSFGCSVFVFAVIGFRHRLHTATSCLPDLAHSLR